MRGENTKQSSMLMLMSPESRVPATHPIRRIKALSDDALAKLSSVFDAMYSSTGRPSIPPERLLKATLLMALYSVRSERQFCEQLDYNLLFRWFLDMDMTEASFDATAFTHNRARLIAHDVAGEFFRAVVDQAKAANLMSSDHFTVDGTLIEAAASLKSFAKRKDSGEPRSRRTTRGIRPSTFTVRSGATRRTSRRRIRTRSSRVRARVRRRSSRTRRTR